MQWLTGILLASLYPGAPYERKFLAVLLLNTVLEVWRAPTADTKFYSRVAAAVLPPGDKADSMLVGGVVRRFSCQHASSGCCQKV